jgi:regulatory protein
VRRKSRDSAAKPAPLPADAYVTALRMLAMRELSATQVRERLTRRGHAEEDIDAAVARLTAERSLDDARVAAAIARTETGLRKRGRLRVKRRIEAAGIAPAIAQQAVDDTFQDIDADALLAAALEKRLRGRTNIADDREFQRLYRYLASQGFESDRILPLLRARRANHADRDSHEEP